MKQKLTMQLTFSLEEVLATLKAQYPEIPPGATIRALWHPVGDTKNKTEIVVSFDLPDPPPTTSEEEDMNEPITEFRGPTRWLSSFEYAEVLIDGKTYARPMRRSTGGWSPVVPTGKRSRTR